MVSLKDIAAECGLSLTQVSRALNDHKDVSAKTKARVREAADRLGYVKNINAQILATRNSNQIAVIIYGIDKDKNAEPSIIYNIVKGINRYAKENGYEAVVYLNEDPELSYLNFCKQRGLAGVILFGVNYEDNSFKQIVESDFPCVVVDIQIEGKNKGCVVVNNIYYSMEVTSHLIQKGRRHIGMLCGHGHSMVEVERRMGYEMALKRNGIPVDESIIIKAYFDLEKAYEKTKKLMTDHPEIDGLFCANDFMALGALRALKEIGKKVPEEVSVIGFDGIVLGEYSSPPLSTVKQDNVRKGYCAARQLCDILNDRHQEHTVVVPCEIVLRSSD